MRRRRSLMPLLVILLPVLLVAGIWLGGLYGVAQILQTVGLAHTSASRTARATSSGAARGLWLWCSCMISSH
jgi:hypothetical protein